MKSLEENYDRFTKLNTLAFGIGVDSVPSNKAWAQSLGLKNTQLLCDFWPHGEISQLYEVFRDKDGFSERANIVIDEDQKVIFARLYPLDQLPDIKEILAVLEATPGT